MTDADYIVNYWHYADMQENILSNDIDNRQDGLHDELQDILDHFRNIQLSGKISRSEVNRLHRKIDQWQRAGYDVGEFRLIMRDLDHRTRIKGNEALLAFLMAAFVGVYQPVMKETRRMLLNVSQETYKREFKAAHEITGKGRMSPPGESTVTEWLENPIPSGGTFENDMHADAMYRARQLQKFVNAEMKRAETPLGSKKPLNVDSVQFKRALKIQRDWMLRRSQHGANKNNHAGQIDMYMAYVVSETVVRAFRDAGVKTYQFVAMIDDRTTDTCRSLHLKVFPLKDIQIGINAPPTYPPFHYCRSIIRAVE